MRWKRKRKKRGMYLEVHPELKNIAVFEGVGFGFL
jgi:hypothetical protein